MDVNVMQVNEDKFPALPGGPSYTPPAPPHSPPPATQPSASSTKPKAADGYGLWGPPSTQQDANPSAAQSGTLSQQQPSWDQAIPVDSGWGQEHHQEDVWDQTTGPSRDQGNTGWGQNHHQADAWGQNHHQADAWGQKQSQEDGWDQHVDPRQPQADPIKSGWGQQHPLKGGWDRYIGPGKELPASNRQHWEKKTDGSQQQQQNRGSGWDQPDMHAQGIWEQPQDSRQQDPWQNPWNHPDQGTWGQPRKQASYNKPQQGSWEQPAQEPSSALNQDGWDVPVEDAAHAPYNGRGGWDEGPTPGPYDNPSEVSGLNWQGLVGKGPSSTGQGTKQTEWDPRPDYRADSYRYLHFELWQHMSSLST